MNPAPGFQDNCKVMFEELETAVETGALGECFHSFSCSLNLPLVLPELTINMVSTFYFLNMNYCGM